MLGWAWIAKFIQKFTAGNRNPKTVSCCKRPTVYMTRSPADLLPAQALWRLCRLSVCVCESRFLICISLLPPRKVVNYSIWYDGKWYRAITQDTKPYNAIKQCEALNLKLNSAIAQKKKCIFAAGEYESLFHTQSLWFGNSIGSYVGSEVRINISMLPLNAWSCRLCRSLFGCDPGDVWLCISLLFNMYCVNVLQQRRPTLL